MKTPCTIFVLLVFSNVFCQNPFAKGPKPLVDTQVKEEPTIKPATNCISGNCIDGWGAWKFDKVTYEGFWENGKCHGFGFFLWDDEGTYAGFSKDNFIEGTGIYVNADKDIFRGIYKNGKLNGFGEESFVDYDDYDEIGSSKRGIYKDHVLETSYEFKFNNVDLKCVYGDCTDKYGLYKWNNGDKFQGFFKGGIQHFGSYHFYNGDIYFGYFNAEGRFTGQAIYNFENGEFYGGEFLNGKFHGKGYYADKDGKTKIGVWENGTLIKSL